MIPNGPKTGSMQLLVGHELALILNHLALSVSSPEKAGVGGSIPSLATMFSITYKPLKASICSILFQYSDQGSPRFVSEGYLLDSGDHNM
jgi:hypothetical protein